MIKSKSPFTFGTAVEIKDRLRKALLRDIAIPRRSILKILEDITELELKQMTYEEVGEAVLECLSTIMKESQEDISLYSPAIYKAITNDTEAVHYCCEYMVNISRYFRFDDEDSLLERLVTALDQYPDVNLDVQEEVFKRILLLSELKVQFADLGETIYQTIIGPNPDKQSIRKLNDYLIEPFFKAIVNENEYALRSISVYETEMLMQD